MSDWSDPMSLRRREFEAMQARATLRNNARRHLEFGREYQRLRALTPEMDDRVNRATGERINLDFLDRG